MLLLGILSSFIEVSLNGLPISPWKAIKKAYKRPPYWNGVKHWNSSRSVLVLVISTSFVQSVIEFSPPDFLWKFNTISSASVTGKYLYGQIEVELFTNQGVSDKGLQYLASKYCFGQQNWNKIFDLSFDYIKTVEQIFENPPY